MISVLIGVRVGSSRLPAKCLLPLASGMTVLKHIVARTAAAEMQPVICTVSEDLEIIKNHLGNNAVITVGPLENKLKRLKIACDTLGVSEFHSLDADDPYFCPLQIRKSMAMLKEQSVVFPSLYSDHGGATEGYSFRASALLPFNYLSDDKSTTYFPHHFEDIEIQRVPCVSYHKKQTPSDCFGLSFCCPC